MNDTRRELQGLWLVLSRILLGALPIVAIIFALQLLPEMGIVLYKEQFLIVMLTIAVVLVVITIPPLRPREGQPLPTSVPWYDVFLTLAMLGAGGYTAGYYNVLVHELGLLTTDKIVVSAVGIIILLEATRRVAGYTMMAIGLIALAYTFFGNNLEGLFEIRRFSLERIAVYNYMNPGSIHGIPLFVASTVVTMFILFGQMLFAVGAGQAISDFSFSLMGRRRGGAAKVSVVASALFGSLSGSASANVATTGMLTIPMMRQTGYADYKAAAIEAVASTGGLILPPIMAATGFIMAEFLGVPYAEVALAATLPALLFYFCVFLQVDFEARKAGLAGWTGGELPKVWRSIIAVLPVLFPVAVLLYSLFGLHRSAELSGFFATVATIAISLVIPSMRRNWRTYFKVLVSTGDKVIFVIIVTAIAGLVVGCLGLTGLGSTLAQKLVEVADGNVWVLLAMAALGSIVLGMGVPVTATYIILVVLVGPALVQVGIPELAAHMFVFYYGTLSFLTPPVAISVFVAAALAGSAPMKTAFFALRLAIVAYLIPFLFVFETSYLLEGSALQIGQTVVSALAGIGLLSIGLVGYVNSQVPIILRIIVIVVGGAILWWGPSMIAVTGGGVALVVGLYFYSMRHDTISSPGTAGQSNQVG